MLNVFFNKFVFPHLMSRKQEEMMKKDTEKGRETV